MIGTKHNWLNTLLDSGTLLIALAVDLALNLVCMTTLGPGPWEKVGFAGLAIITVLFSVRAYLKGTWKGVVIFIIYATVAVFFDTSFTLEATRTQAENTTVVITIENDPILKNYKEIRSKAELQLEQLNKDFNESVRGTTIDSVLEDRKTYNAIIAQYNNLITVRTEEVISGKASKNLQSSVSDLSATKIFNAIPNAIKSKRFIPLTVFLLIFVALQLTIISAASETKKVDKTKPKVKKKKTQKPTLSKMETVVDDKKDWEKLIDLWLDIIYENNPAILLTDKDFFDKVEARNGEMTKPEYNRIRRAATISKVIIDGEIAVQNKDIARSRIKKDRVFNV